MTFWWINNSNDGESQIEFFSLEKYGEKQSQKAQRSRGLMMMIDGSD